MGRRRVRTGADDRKVGVVVALRDEPLADLPCDIGFGPPDQAPPGDLADHAIGGLRREAQQGDLIGILDHAQVAQDRRGERVLDGGTERRLEAQQVHGQHRVGDGDASRSQVPRREGIRVIGLIPGPDLERGLQARFRGAPFESGDDDERVPAGRHHEDGEALERHRRIAGQVAQVGSDADEQRVQAGRARRGGCALQSLGEARAGDDRAGDEGHDPISAGRPSQAATVAGPSSNSLR